MGRGGERKRVTGTKNRLMRQWHCTGGEGTVMGHAAASSFAAMTSCLEISALGPFTVYFVWVIMFTHTVIWGGIKTPRKEIARSAGGVGWGGMGVGVRGRT